MTKQKPGASAYRNERSVMKGIFEHKKRTSTLYAELAHAPEALQREFLESIPNPLVRRYAAQRVADATFDVAITRIEKLDPYPYEHQHEGCPMHGARGQERDEHDVFLPREGFITDEEAYQ